MKQLKLTAAALALMAGSAWAQDSSDPGHGAGAAKPGPDRRRSGGH